MLFSAEVSYKIGNNIVIIGDIFIVLSSSGFSCGLDAFSEIIFNFMNELFSN